MIITSLNKQGAQKIFYSLCIGDLNSKNSNCQCVVISFLDGYYRKLLIAKNVKTFVILQKTFLLTIKSIMNCFFNVALISKKINLIHSFLPHAGFLGIILKFIFRKPLLYSIRFDPESKMFNKRRFLVLLNEICCQLADGITCNSPTVQLYLNKKFKSKSIFYIPNGIDYSVFSDIRKKYHNNCLKGFIDNSTNILTTCNLRNEGKDISTLIKVASECKDLNFNVVGGGPMLPRLEREAKILNVQNIYFSGHQDDILPYLAKADLFIFLSLAEGFPNSILEAMAASLPVLVSDLPIIRAIFQDENHCMFLENGNVMQICTVLRRIVTDTKLQEKLVNNAILKIINDFTIEKMLSNFENAGFKIKRL